MNIEMRKGPAVWSVAPICGLVALPFASFFEIGLLRSYLGPASTIVPIFIGAALTGFLVGAVSRSDDVEEARKPSFDDASTRAGFRAAILAAAALVLRATLQVGEPGRVAFPAFFVLFVAVVTLFPATLLAMMAGGFGRAFKAALSGDPQAGRPKFRFQPVHWLYAACILVLFSPFIPGLLTSPPPPVPVGQPVAIVQPQPPEPLPPPFRYAKPADLASAPPSRFRVIADKRIDAISIESPGLISPDGKLFAFCSEAQELRVFDLDGFTQICNRRPGGAIIALAWSPDNQRLAVVFGEGPNLRIGIVTPADQGMKTLPRPKGVEIPDDGISWIAATEVLLHAQGKAPMALNLDSLEFRMINDAPFYKALDGPKRVGVALAPVATAASSSRWMFEVAWAVKSAGPQFQKSAYKFETSGHPCVAARDSETGARTHLPELALKTRDRLVFAPDGSKVVIIREANATIHYIGLRDPSPAAHRLEMKRKPAELPEPAELEKSIEEKSLFAFVYAPLINPLTQKTVGADWDRVKGVVRVANWTDTVAETSTFEEFAPLSSSDIVSELHRWERAQAKPIVTYAGTPWWAPVGEPQTAKTAAAPGKLPQIQNEPIISVAKDAYTLTLTGVSQPTIPALLPIPDAPTSNVSVPNANRPQTQVGEPVGIRLIGWFIEQHHLKSSNADLDGLMADYADRVQHFKAGMVTKEFIRAEEAKYRTPGSRVTERVRGNPQIWPLSEKLFRTTYELSFLNLKADGSWTSGVANVVKEIQLTASGPRITMQNSVSRESEKRKGRGTPPSI